MTEPRHISECLDEWLETLAPLTDQIAQDDADEQAQREQHAAEQRETFRAEHERHNDNATEESA